MVLAHPSVPAKTLPELLAYAKAEPDKLAIATDGARRFSGMIAAWINKLAGTAISYVPYVQMTQGVQDALAGRVQLIILAVPTARGHIASGTLRPLAVTSGAACRASTTSRPSPKPSPASISPAGGCWPRPRACPPPSWSA